MLRRALTQLREDESGFSLTELLTAMVIGSVVLWALMTLMTTGFTKSLEVSDRAEAAQVGRQAMDRVTTLLDSTICLDPVSGTTSIPPLVGTKAATAGPPAIPAQVGSDGNYVGFYADLDGVSSSPDRYTITYDPTAKTLTERRYDGVGTLPNTSWPSLSRTRVLASGVIPADNASGVNNLPIFSYYKFESNGTINYSAPLATPIDQTVAAQVVAVRIAFEVVSSRTRVEDRRATAIEGQAPMGVPDPMTPNAGSCP